MDNSDSLPLVWQWVGLVAGLLGLGIAVMALPTIFQMFFGAPKLRIEFDSSISPDGRVKFLLCEIFNDPVRNRMLRWLGVQRSTAEDVLVVVSVRDQGGGKSYCNGMIMSKSEAGVAQLRARLPGSRAPLEVLILHMGVDDGAAHITDMLGDPSGHVEIPPGIYDCDVRVETGHMSFDARGTFRVGNDHSRTTWLKDAVKER